MGHGVDRGTERGQCIAWRRSGRGFKRQAQFTLEQMLRVFFAAEVADQQAARERVYGYGANVLEFTPTCL